MQLVAPGVLAFDYLPGGVELKAIARWAKAHPRSKLWACYDCGEWQPTA
jgi:hypothetical protein